MHHLLDATKPATATLAIAKTICIFMTKRIPSTPFRLRILAFLPGHRKRSPNDCIRGMGPMTLTREEGKATIPRSDVMAHQCATPSAASTQAFAHINHPPSLDRGDGELKGTM